MRPVLPDECLVVNIHPIKPSLQYVVVVSVSVCHHIHVSIDQAVPFIQPIHPSPAQPSPTGATGPRRKHSTQSIVCLGVVLDGKKVSFYVNADIQDKAAVPKNCEPFNMISY